MGSLLNFAASERVEFLGESLQLKVTQCVVAVFAVLVQVQMHGVFCGAVRGDPFRKCFRGGFALVGVSLPLSIWTVGMATEILAMYLQSACCSLEYAFSRSSVTPVFHCIWTRGVSWWISATKSYSVCCSGFCGFGSGLDAWGVLWCRSVRPFPEMPPGQVCILRYFISTKHLNLGYCCWNSCNALAVSVLDAWIRIFAEFRCSCFLLHLNTDKCLGCSCNWKLFSELWCFLRFWFRFRCMGCFVVPFGEALSGSACRAGLHSGVFHSHWASEPRVLLLKFFQYAWCERVRCLNLHFGGVQMLLFSGASERVEFLGESLQVKVIQWVVVVFAVFVQVQMLPFSAVLCLPHIL